MDHRRRADEHPADAPPRLDARARLELAQPAHQDEPGLEEMDDRDRDADTVQEAPAEPLAHVIVNRRRGRRQRGPVGE